jgi:hypothetical protein
LDLLAFLGCGFVIGFEDLCWLRSGHWFLIQLVLVISRQPVGMNFSDNFEAGAF